MSQTEISIAYKLAMYEARNQLLEERVQMAEEAASLAVENAGNLEELAKMVSGHAEAHTRSKHVVAVEVLHVLCNTLQSLAESESVQPSVLYETADSLKEVIKLL